MLDMKLIRENPQAVIDGLKKKGRDAAEEIREVLALDEKRREIIARSETLRAEQNQVSKQLPRLKKEGIDVAGTLEKMKEIAATIKEDAAALRETEDALNAILLAFPNLPDEDVLPGGKENNAVVRTFGKLPEFGFEPQNHVDLCQSLGLIDYARGAKLAGSGFWVYRGMGARMEWALLNYFIDTHLGDGYELLFVPHILGYEAGLTSGQFPKFEDDVFWLEGEARKQFLLPTAETALVGLHQGELLDEADLPRKYIAFTPCYRREAGSYRAEERGMIRGHQFNKVEMVQYTAPENSAEAFEELVAKAERLMQGLGLHFQTVKLAAEDCSASMARTYDIEVYIPSMGGYKEVSSASNAGDYQARRGNMRYRDSASGKNRFVHTLNASGLATSRLLPAIVEQNQMKDGSVRVPEVLRKYMGNVEILKNDD
ncbi:serine--tRNA ligase [Oscillospiraceae bacterium OttesenSCG-928-F05]|nr:serine--tRNA ligase [Oscillospiraceae bacterium OttesenSCG-928-F05]